VLLCGEPGNIRWTAVCRELGGTHHGDVQAMSRIRGIAAEDEQIVLVCCYTAGFLRSLLSSTMVALEISGHVPRMGTVPCATAQANHTPSAKLRLRHRTLYTHCWRVRQCLCRPVNMACLLIV
jgi:hypothetical protein